MGQRFREFRGEDQPALARLFERADRHDGVARALSPGSGDELPLYALAVRYPLGLERGITPAELRSRLGSNLAQVERHILVAGDGDGINVCVSVYPVGSAAQWMLDWVADPAQREKIELEEILEAGLAQIGKLAAEGSQGKSDPGTANGQRREPVVCGVDARGLIEDEVTRNALNRAGFAGVRSFAIMARDLGDGPSEGEKAQREAEGIVLRSYRAGDAPAWIEAFNRSFSDHWGGFYYTEESWGRHAASPRFRKEISVVAEADSGFAGICHCAPSLSLKEKGLAHLHILGVKPAFRRRGLGYHLMVAALQRLRENGFSRVELDMDTLNSKALPLYQMLGFCEQEVITMYSRQLTA